MNEHADRSGHVVAPGDLRRVFRWWQGNVRADNPPVKTRAAWDVAFTPFHVLDEMSADSAVAARVADRATRRARLIAAGRTLADLRGGEWEALSESDIWPDGVPSADSRVGASALPGDPAGEVRPVGAAGAGPPTVVFPGPPGAVVPVADGVGGGVGEGAIHVADETVRPGHSTPPPDHGRTVSPPMPTALTPGGWR